MHPVLSLRTSASFDKLNAGTTPAMRFAKVKVSTVSQPQRPELLLVPSTHRDKLIERRAQGVALNPALADSRPRGHCAVTAVTYRSISSKAVSALNLSNRTGRHPRLSRAV